MKYILVHSEARLAITEPQYAAAIHAVAPGCPTLGAVLEARPLAPLLAHLPATSPGGPVTILDEISMQYTSGTTAKPKGVLLTHANYIYGGEVMSKAMRVLPTDRHLIVLPLFHAGAQLHAFVPMLLAGGSVALMDRFSATRFVEQATRHEATLSALFAAPIRMLLDQPRSSRDRQTQLRTISYAQNITPQQFEEWHGRFGASLMQIWGMTETMSLPLMQPLDLPRKPLSMGMPALGYECRIVDESGTELPPGTVGELVVSGVPGISLMKGYVAASEVEEVLKQHPAVFDAAVVGVPDPFRDQAIKAYIILKKNAVVTADELGGWCRRHLSAFKVPAIVEFREVFPRTSVGKIQKHLL
jgi:crotonobetaine/carnitine-CoA ligase